MVFRHTYLITILKFQKLLNTFVLIDVVVVVDHTLAICSGLARRGVVRIESV
jgi:hypothetical protein